MITGLDHIYLSVSDFDRSEAYYDTVMRTLGFRKGDKPIAGERHAHYFNPALQLTIRPARASTQHDAYSPGLHHLCLQATDRATVDEAHRQLVDAGIDATPPAVYSEYNPEYYATFFDDPDGLRLEIVGRTRHRDEIAARWDDLQAFVNPIAELHEREGDPFNIRALTGADYAWVDQIVTEHFASPRVVSRGVLHQAADLPGLVAEDGGRPIGLLQYHLRATSLEVVILISLEPGRGIGRQLLSALKPITQANGCQRLWLVTTNNNEAAIRFYEKLGWERAAVYRGVVADARALKPELPEGDADGTPITDEIEFQLRVDDQR
jgi:catechol 2,3-dioxygenase-like lactoylglutathione lyase family enzyme/predicted N-acetyltransferase YhbS